MKASLCDHRGGRARRDFRESFGNQMSTATTGECTKEGKADSFQHSLIDVVVPYDDYVHNFRQAFLVHY